MGFRRSCWGQRCQNYAVNRKHADSTLYWDLRRVIRGTQWQAVHQCLRAEASDPKSRSLGRETDMVRFAQRCTTQSIKSMLSQILADLATRLSPTVPAACLSVMACATWHVVQLVQ